MELTPIKVRGKRRAQNQPVNEPPQKRSHRDQSTKKKSKIRRPKFSDLEKSMPLEVLEQIFWLSENVNFPRASPRLGRLLSGPATLRETFLCAFGPTWDNYFSKRQSSVVYLEWTDLVLRENGFSGNPDFQTAVLACPWATIDMILDCWDAWVRRNARDDRQFPYAPLWGDPVDPPPYADSGVTLGATKIREARHYFYHDYYAFRNVEKLGSPESAGQRWSNPDCAYDSWLEIHPSTEIPDNLIIGPWDEPSLQKLFWLVRAGARLSTRQTWEITHKGFSNAVNLDPMCPNMTIVRLLNSLGAFEIWPKHIQEDEASRIDSMRKRGDISAVTHAIYCYDYIRLLIPIDAHDND